MQREELYLRDIINATEAIEIFLDNISETEFSGNELLQSAVLHKLTIIGEAAARISQDLKNRHNEIEWKTIVGFRNIVVHEYFAIDWKIVWTTATVDVPVLRSQTQEILKQEFSDKT